MYTLFGSDILKKETNLMVLLFYGTYEKDM